MGLISGLGTNSHAFASEATVCNVFYEHLFLHSEKKSNERDCSINMDSKLFQRLTSDPELRNMFRFDYVECLDGNKDYSFNLDLNHWFYLIKQEDLDRNSKLQQNNEWGGSFILSYKIVFI